MSDFTDQLKAQADIGQLIGEKVALQPNGQGWTGLCPFHSEKSPSFNVHRQRRFYHCFGCGAHGDIFSFYMQLQKLSFSEAVALVAERLDIPLPRSTGNDTADPRRASLLKIHAVAAEFFSEALRGREGAPARAYLQEREVPDGSRSRFAMGYAPAEGRALAHRLQRNGFEPELALQAGLCQPRRASESQDRLGKGPATTDWNDLYDRFRGRIVFPIGDERGQVIAFGARAFLPEDLEKKVPKYLNSPETPVYTKGRVVYNLHRAKESIRQLGYFVLVEGYLDCLRVSTAGFENVVASCGTALTPPQISTLARFSTKALINFDPDGAGTNAAERSIGLLLEEGLQVHVVSLPDGLDPDLFIRRRGREAYATALRERRPFFDFLADRARKQFDLRRGDGKVAALNFLLPYLSRVQDAIVRQDLAESLASQLGVDRPLVSDQLLKAARARRVSLPVAAATGPGLLAGEQLIWRAWLEWDAQRPTLTAILADENLLDGLVSAPLADLLLKSPFATSTAELDFAGLTEGIDPADRELLSSLLMSGSAEPLTETGLSNAVEALRERRRDQDRKVLLGEIKSAAERQDRGRLEELLRRRQAMDRSGARAPLYPQN